MDIIDFIKAEHAFIFKNFDALMAQAKDLTTWKALCDFCEFSIEDNHHKKEEIFIFNAVKDDPRIRAGGPMCSLYFDSHIASPTLKRATDLAQALTGKSFGPQWSEQMKDFIAKDLPLVVPGEDHEAGRILVRAARHFLEGSTAIDNQAMTQIFRTYRDIQRSHFEREENCFLRMCKELIPPDRRKSLLVEIQAAYPILYNPQFGEV